MFTGQRRGAAKGFARPVFEALRQHVFLLRDRMTHWEFRRRQPALPIGSGTDRGRGRCNDGLPLVRLRIRSIAEPAQFALAERRRVFVDAAHDASDRDQLTSLRRPNIGVKPAPDEEAAFISLKKQLRALLSLDEAHELHRLTEKAGRGRGQVPAGAQELASRNGLRRFTGGDAAEVHGAAENECPKHSASTSGPCRRFSSWRREPSAPALGIAWLCSAWAALPDTSSSTRPSSNPQLSRPDSFQPLQLRPGCSQGFGLRPRFFLPQKGGAALLRVATASSDDAQETQATASSMCRAVKWCASRRRLLGSRERRPVRSSGWWRTRST